MGKFNCKNATNFVDFNDFFECGSCGNHVCKAKAEQFNKVCPHCFGKLYRVN